MNDVLFSNLSYDIHKDFTPVSMLISTPQVLVTHPSVGAKDVKELAAFIRANPAKANYGSPGVGSYSHLAGEMLGFELNTKLLHVPYQGLAPAVNDLLGGNISMMFCEVITAVPHIRSGKMTPIAIAHSTRAPWLPNVPTTAEVGLPNVLVSSWYGLMARAGTPAPVMAKIVKDVREIMQSAEMKKRYDDIGAYALQFARRVRRLHQVRNRQMGRVDQARGHQAAMTTAAPRIYVHYLNHADVQALAMTDAEILDAVEAGLLAQGRGETTIEPRMHLVPEKDYPGHFNVLRGYIRPLALAGVKVVGDFYRNYEVGLPSELAMLNLFDPKNGAPVAIIDASDITDMRTGAVTAIGAKHLARKDSKVLGHIGARGTSYWNVRLLDSIFDFDEIRVHSRRPKAAKPSPHSCAGTSAKESW